ncbi:MAG TPA: hypothetical protein VGP02_14730 [Mycobacteriales bacterium]|nr:hypothetical protein [Mycobacteriales bacterium]
MTAAAAALLLAAAVVILAGGRPSLRERVGIPSRWTLVPGLLRTRGAAALGRGSSPGHGTGVLGAVVLAGGGAGWAWAGPVAAGFAATYAVLVLRAVRDSRGRRAGRWAAAAVEDLVSGLAADLRAGLLPAAALEAGAEALSFAGVPTSGRARRAGGPSFRAALAPVLGAVSAGDDVPAALRVVRLAGAAPGDPGAAADGLTKLAAAWQVAEQSGAPLADVLDRLDAELGAAGRLRDRTEAHTAAASATVRLLAVLPVLGIGIGYALGGDPMRILFHTATGTVCAVVALALQVTGVLWAERITDGRPVRASRVRSPSPVPSPFPASARSLSSSTRRFSGAARGPDPDVPP